IVNLFDTLNEYKGYYELEIDLKQIDPTIQSINKFIDTYETIEISNIANFSITNTATKINMYEYKDIELFAGRGQCNFNLGKISDLNYEGGGSQQITNANFPQNQIVKTNEISTEIKQFVISYADDLNVVDYSQYKTKNQNQMVLFLMQISTINNIKPHKTKNVYLELYYTNDVKLKIRFTKTILPKFMGTVGYPNWGNQYNLTFSQNSNDLIYFTNNGNNPVKITFKPK
ncbi:hypothetical protein, partial [Spiroplasma phoeniceum]|uniref:hypothetical protein n=1 Tax=Spiroplasma phoeniceum TaxID=47835 RepID=UPI003364DFB9